MKQKLITTLLITSMSLGFILSIPPKSTNAETLTNVESEISSKYVADKNIIKTIENKYLKQNSDGTFFISDEAYNEFDKETIESLKSGMEGINDYILSGKLKFKIMKKNNNNKVINTYQSENINNKRQPRAALTLGKIVSNYEYCSNYQWYWWGYKTNVNAKGSALLRNNFIADAAVVGGSATLASVLCPPAIPIIASLGFIGEVRYASVILECSNGTDSGKGVQVTGWGKPSAGAVFAVKAYY